MWTASSCGNLVCLEALIQLGLDVNMCNIDGQSPLHVAAEGNFSSCVAALILAKADVNTSEYVIMFFI